MIASRSAVRSRCPCSSLGELWVTYLFTWKTTLNLTGGNHREHHCIHYLDVKGYVNSRMNLIRHKATGSIMKVFPEGQQADPGVPAEPCASPPGASSCRAVETSILILILILSRSTQEGGGFPFPEEQTPRVPLRVKVGEAFPPSSCPLHVVGRILHPLEGTIQSPGERNRSGNVVGRSAILLFAANSYVG